MTEKRFKYKVTDGFFDGDRLISIKEVVDLLNEQQATIEAKDSLLSILSKENEQLRQQLKTICNTCCYDCEEEWCEK